MVFLSGITVLESHGKVLGTKVATYSRYYVIFVVWKPLLKIKRRPNNTQKAMHEMFYKYQAWGFKTGIMCNCCKSVKKKVCNNDFDFEVHLFLIFHWPVHTIWLILMLEWRNQKIKIIVVTVFFFKEHLWPTVS